MAKVTLNTDITLDIRQLLESVAQLDTPDLEKFHASVGLMLENRNSETSIPYPLSAAEDMAEDTAEDTVENIPIVETLIPKSISFG